MAEVASSWTGSPGMTVRRLSSAAPLDGAARESSSPATSADQHGSAGTRRTARRSPGAGARWASRMSVAAILVLSGGGEVSAQAPGVGQNVCDRTYQVSDAIVTASGVANCAYVTLHDLREITALDLSYRGILSLSAGDFDGLVRLGTLDLSENALTTLPQGVFDELLLLRTLRLDSNQLRSLPVHLFDELFMLEELRLQANPLLPPDPRFGDRARFAGAQDTADLPSWGVDAGSLDRFLNGVYTVEQFIAALPALHKERFAMVFASESPARDHVSINYPRIVSWGGDGRFTFSWNTDPAAPAQFRDGVEFLRRGDSEWSAGIIDFSGGAPTVTEPALCQTCHGPLNKPLWGAYMHWRGTDYEKHGHARRAFESTNPRIEPLDFSASHVIDGSRYLKSGCYGCLSAVEEADNVLAWRHAEVLFRRLKAREDFRQFAENTVCVSDPFETPMAALDPFALGDHNLAVEAHTGQVIQGGSMEDLSVAPDYHYGVYGSLGGALVFLLVVDLWEQEPIVRKLYREVSNLDTLIPWMREELHRAWLYYDAGSATAEDELIMKLGLHFGNGNRETLVSPRVGRRPLIPIGHQYTDVRRDIIRPTATMSVIASKTAARHQVARDRPSRREGATAPWGRPGARETGLALRRSQNTTRETNSSGIRNDTADGTFGIGAGCTNGPAAIVALPLPRAGGGPSSSWASGVRFAGRHVGAGPSRAISRRTGPDGSDPACVLHPRRSAGPGADGGHRRDAERDRRQ